MPDFNDGYDGEEVEAVATAIWLSNNPQWHSATPEQIAEWWEAISPGTKELKWRTYARAAIRCLERREALRSRFAAA